MSHGYIYCFSNPCMPGILKIGMTKRTPDKRLGEANTSDTWRPPIPYMIEFAKKVTNPREKETNLHDLLKKYRINPDREFFTISHEEVRKEFDRIDGTMWDETHEENDDDSEEEEHDDDSDYEEEEEEEDDDDDDSDYESDEYSD